MKKESLSTKKLTEKSKKDSSFNLNISKDFDIHPFLWGKRGIDFIDMILKNKDFSEESRDEIYKKFIISLYDNSESIGNMKKIKITTELQNYYKGNLTIQKTDLLKELENNPLKNPKKFNKLSQEEQSKATQITVVYLGYEYKMNGLNAKIEKKVERNINYENLSLAKFLTSIAKSLTTDRFLELIKTKEIKDFFTYYAENIVDTINHPLAPDKLGLIAPKNFCTLYQSYNYQKNQTIDNALRSIFVFNPEIVIEAVCLGKNFDLYSDFNWQILSTKPSTKELELYFLKDQLEIMLLENKYKLCLETIKKYLLQPGFHEVLKDTVNFINQSAIHRIERNDLWNEILTALDISESKLSEIVTIVDCDVFLPLLITETNPYKNTILLHLSFNKVNRLIEVMEKLSKNTSKMISLNFVLDNLFIALDPNFISEIYKLLKKVYISDKVCLKKIITSEKLYKVKLASEEYVKKLSESNIIDKIENSVEKDDSKDEIDLLDLAQEAKNYIQDSEDLTTCSKLAIHIPIVETDPQVLIHRAYQLQKKLTSKKKESKIIDIESQSWVVNSIKITYSEKVTEASSQYNVKKITTSFGLNLYIAIKEECIKAISQEKKFIDASDHWAAAFYNKSGIKLLTTQNGSKLGYEIKIMNENLRLVTQKLYKNPQEKSLLIFDQLLNHEAIDKLESPLTIDDVQSDIIGDILSPMEI